MHSQLILSAHPLEPGSTSAYEVLQTFELEYTPKNSIAWLLSSQLYLKPQATGWPTLVSLRSLIESARLTRTKDSIVVGYGMTKHAKQAPREWACTTFACRVSTKLKSARLLPRAVRSVSKSSVQKYYLNCVAEQASDAVCITASVP